jgi:hypothetical protein
VLVAFAVIGVFSGSDEPIIPLLRGTVAEELAVRLHTGNEIIFGMSVSFLTGVFVWFLVAWIPEQRKRAVLRTNLSRRYQQFKEDVIQILLWVSIGTHEYDLPRELSDFEAFQKFFKENSNQKWYAALNGLQENPDKLSDLLVELEIMANEVAYVLNNLDVADDEVHSFFKRLTEHIYKLRSSSLYTYDQVKYLGNFLWEILAQWSFIDGQRENDVVKDMIERI